VRADGAVDFGDDGVGFFTRKPALNTRFARTP